MDIKHTLVIGDTHGSMPALYDVMSRAGAIEWNDDKDDYVRLPGWRIIHVGDLANMAPWGQTYRGFMSTDKEALQFALDGFIDEITIGNHELYFTHSLHAGQWYGMALGGELEPGTQSLINQLVDKGIYVAATEAHGHLISHAGLAPQLQKHFSDDPAIAAKELNEALMFVALGEGSDPAITNIGHFSGGHGYGGIFWLRPFECSKHEWKSTKYVQIVGHTPNADHPLYDDLTHMWMIDSGGYMQGLGSGLVFHHGISDNWEILPAA